MKFILGIIFGILVIIFMAQNPQVVDITFLAWTFSISRAVMYLLIFILGFVSGGLITGIRRIRKIDK
jgi:uncharacterized integral membrane protein